MSANPTKRRFQATGASQCNCDCDCAKAVKNLEDHFKLLTDLVVTISNKIDGIQEQNNEIQPQISALLNAMTSQKDTMNSLVRQQCNISLITEFPINSSEDMTKMDLDINNQNREQYMLTITNLLKPNGVEKQLKNVLTDDFVMSHNLDGIHGKLAIRSYKNIYDVLIEAIQAHGGSGSAEDQFRRALQLQKKRVFRRRSNPVKTEKSVDNFESVYF